MSDTIPDPGCIPLVVFRHMYPDGVPSFDSEWHTSDVMSLAHSIEVEEAYDRLPILADALEEAGCSDPLILSHCRHHHEHEIHCWVLGLIREDAQSRNEFHHLLDPLQLPEPMEQDALLEDVYPSTMAERVIWRSCQFGFVIIAICMAYTLIGAIVAFCRMGWW